MPPASPFLLPQPRSLELCPGELRLPDAPTLALAAPTGRGERALARLRAGLERRAGLDARRVDGDALLRLRLDPAARLPDEAFQLAIGSDGLSLLASDERGLYWGAGAVDQLLSGSGRALPALRIEDAPDFPVRGYMLDVSRDRVPTRHSLEGLVGTLSALRINQLQLYTEHTFAYREHERVWAEASPLTHDEVRWLDALCAEHELELVPNQNSFGHMERWLRHPEYRHLAERPDDGGARPPACLVPGAQSLAFMRGLYDELLPCFTSRSVNIGCDETFELGRGRSREACEERGRGRVYLDHLLGLVRDLRARGRSVQFWGDIVLAHPELLPELRETGLIALAWGYEAPLDAASLPPAAREQLAAAGVETEVLGGFGPRVRPFAASGLPFWVCPGTSTWNSLVGRLPNALGNLLDAAESGLAEGASGFLITDWGDNGHLQPPGASLPPLAYGAAVSWCLERNRDLDLERALSEHVLADPTGELAASLVRLGEAYTGLGLVAFNASPLALALLRPPDARLRVFGETDPERLDAVVGELDAAVEGLARARPAAEDGAVLARELAQAAALARHGAWRLGRALLERGPTPAELRRDLLRCIEEQAKVWRLRSREGGLRDSLARLRTRLDDYAESDRGRPARGRRARR